ncbi:MAG: 2-hydroxyacid dehydrogenase [Verrucomicrobia bacterium]|nr:MAG: 2-hydroxyacid dehydrogenase [Verrucomicrobiota bacterium]
MKTIKTAFFDAKPYDREAFDAVKRPFGVELKYFSGHLSADTVHVAAGTEAICIFVNDVVTREVADALHAQGVRLIALRCAGYNNVDLKAVYQRIHVVRVPAYSPYAVAEHAAALMLALNRKTHKAYFRTRDGNFSINGLLGFDLNGKTAGVVGTGKIGRVMTGILRGFGMRVLAFDPFPDAAFAQAGGCVYTDLPTLYREADVITLHCPLTPDNRRMINAESIAQMKKGVTIINTGRGKLIDTRALIHGLKSGKVGAAGLDVYEEETDYFFEDFSSTVIDDDVLARLLTFPNVLITSHQAFFTREAMANIAQTTLGNIQTYFTQDQLPNEICYRCSDDACQRKITGKCF